MSRAIKTVEAFEGYPDGKTRHVFSAGVTLSAPGDVPADYADLLIAKGHAREIKVAAKKDSTS